MPLSPAEPSCSVVLASLQLEQVLSLMPETRTPTIKISLVFVVTYMHISMHGNMYIL